MGHGEVECLAHSTPLGMFVHYETDFTCIFKIFWEKGEKYPEDLNQNLLLFDGFLTSNHFD